MSTKDMHRYYRDVQDVARQCRVTKQRIDPMVRFLLMVREELAGECGRERTMRYDVTKAADTLLEITEILGIQVPR